MATKQYKNTSDADIDIPGLGTIPAGERIGLSGEHLPAIIIENFPGLVDTTDLVTEEDTTETSEEPNE